MVLKLFKETFKKSNVSYIEIKQLEVINYKYSSSNIVSFLELVFLNKLNSKHFTFVIFFQRNCGTKTMIPPHDLYIDNTGP